MRIGILTYYGVHNHGAVLQANALRAVLLKQGHECSFLSFDRDYSNISQHQADKYKLGFHSIVFYAKYLFQKGPENIVFNYRKAKMLSAYRKEHLPIAESYESFSGDLAVIGSDEVFSLEIGVNPQLYGNHLRAKHIISYAASFGPTTYEEVVKQGRQQMISEGLHRMDAVSVRDANSKDIVLKVAGIDAAPVCDPVILYGYEKEMQAFVPPLKKYLLIYSYDKNMNDPEEVRCVKDYAKRHGLQLVSVGYHHPWCKSVYASPVQLLGWFKHAELVVTDTFHGTVLSMICNTPMVVKLRGNANKLHFLLSEYGLLDRMTDDFERLEQVTSVPIDFDPLNHRLQEHRKASMKFLNDALKQCE